MGEERRGEEWTGEREREREREREKGEDGEDQNVVWLSEEQFRELGMPDNAKIKPARDAVNALVEEEILEEEAVQDVLREKNEEKQREGERHKTKLREEL